MAKSKGILSVLLALYLAILVVVGCTPSPPTSPSAPAPAVTSTGPITIRYSFSSAPAQAFIWYQVMQFKAEVERRTEGRVKVDAIGPEVLHKIIDSYEAVKSGITDMTIIVLPYTPGVFPLSGILDLPVLGNSTVSKTAASWATYKSGLLDKELKDFKVIGWSSTPPFGVMTTKKRIRKPEDLKGLKLRVSGGAQTELAKAVGASGTIVSWLDVYSAAQKGIIDGSIESYGPGLGALHYEVFKYVLELPGPTTTNVVAMNLNVWNKLPPDIQQIIEKVGTEMSWGHAVTYDSSDKIGRVTFAQHGVETYTPTAEELKPWVDIAKGVHTSYLEQIKKDGVTGGDQVYSFFSKYIDMLDNLKH